ncbi:MAG: tripartite tricarboxylate transporter substrate binding protein [Pigmentiphaga sp.]|uniref:Bug family tripartite tricarboxylate transporter substrate binding protein n=1 Tax=Pigmentiphaga sp. TaxID=1977564 RepID=UPI0029B23CF1|nr:tripartite tricarboxylate transporter substrate binding protein [Pigmentiphaga sp.]MDX3905332.1 tripartite tricarboxylate transporter substrate binding protein [Pigmentiphaga sp.]
MKPIALACLLACAFGPAHAEDYPSRPIRLIAPFAAGSTVDILARALAVPLSKQLGQPVVVENKGGAGGNIGVDMVAKAPKDGYTIGIGTTGPMTVNPALYGARMPFDTKRDLAPVGVIASSPNVLLVHPSVPARSLQELVEYARAHPGKLNFASSGIGSTNHLAGELFKSLANIQVVHVPYKGNQDALTDLLAQRVQILFSGVPPVLSFIKSGQLRALAIAGPQPSAALPGVPTVAQAGLAGAEVVAWYGLIAPAGTPRPVIDRLNGELRKALAQPEVQAQLAAAGADPSDDGPEAFARLIDVELDRWQRVIANAHIKVE